MCRLDLCIYNEPFLINGEIFISTCGNCPHWINTDNEEFYDITDESQWWDSWYETEYAWEMDNGIYDPPVF